MQPTVMPTNWPLHNKGHSEPLSRTLPLCEARSRFAAKNGAYVAPAHGYAHFLLLLTQLGLLKDFEALTRRRVEKRDIKIGQGGRGVRKDREARERETEREGEGESKSKTERAREKGIERAREGGEEGEGDNEGEREREFARLEAQ